MKIQISINALNEELNAFVTIIDDAKGLEVTDDISLVIKYSNEVIKIIDGSDNEHMKLLFYSSEDYLNHVSKLLQRTMYKDSMLEITVDDSLLVMQVCHYNPPNTYLLIICKKAS